jgi:hypothetical protein
MKEDILKKQMQSKKAGNVNFEIVGVDPDDIPPFEVAKPTKTERKAWNKKEPEK